MIGAGIMTITTGSGRPNRLEFECLEQRVLLSAVSFIAAQPFATGSTPTSVVVADLNGEGKPDMVVANNNSDTVSVLMNTTPLGATTPSFADTQDFATGQGPCSVWAADINGDGKPDLIVANYLSGTVSVLLNTTVAGSITPSFSARQDFTTGRGPNSVTVADLNGDGKPDIITANYQDPGTVSVLMNTTAAGAATASFATHQDFLTGDGAWAVSAADINNDGKPDLVVANYDSNTVSVLLNTTAAGAATASFAAHQDFPVGGEPTSVAVADLNGDGTPDLVVTNGSSATVSVLLNTTPVGATTLSFAAEQEFITGSNPQSVSVADLNGDGTPDLAVANTGDGTVSVLLNTTAPGATTFTFAARQDFTTGAGPFFVWVADVNGDGNGDLAVANSNDGTVSVLLNTTTGNVVDALPNITGVSPNAGPIAGGTTVTITGTHLLTASAVKFGTLGGTIVSQTDTQVVATSPAHAAGTVDVTAVTVGGTSATSAADDFTYAAAAVPTLTGVSPAAGPIAGGTTVTITGTHLLTASAVKFGTLGGTIVSQTDTQVVATSPAHAAGTVDVTAVTVGGTSATSAADDFTYAAAAVPTLTGVSPAAGPIAGGTTVTITGTHLLTASAVKFGTLGGTIVSQTDTQVVATSPAHAAGTVDVTAVTVGGTSATSAADDFTYAAAAVPTLTGVSPAAGPIAGGTTVTITGTHLLTASAVKFGTLGGTIVSQTDTQVVATSPAHAAGTVNVTVVTAGGTSAIVAADQFAYMAAPTVTGISPTFGPLAGGTRVTITGTHLLTASAVKFGTLAGAIVSKTDTQIVATSPTASATGIVDVKVVAAGGTSAAVATDQFNYVGLPTITGVSRNAGPLAGGTTVTLTGTYLLTTSAVKFGTVAGIIVSKTPTQVVVTSPAHAAGTVDVTVVTLGGGSATSAADDFTYAAVPTVAAVSPNKGRLAGGTSVTITGTNFLNAAAVKFGTVLASSFTVNSATQITVTSPAGVAGTVNVTVVTAGGTSATSAADDFTYVAAPTVTSISPNTGLPAGGATVTINGTNLLGATAVDFGAVQATSILSDTATQIVAKSPTGSGLVNVTVTTAGGTSSNSAADQFTY